MVDQTSNNNFTLYISHLFTHVPARMVFSVLKSMGLGMMRRNDAVEFKDFGERKSAKIHFDFLFTRGSDGDRNVEILRHLREGGSDAHFQVTYQPARVNPKSGKDEPERFWKVSLWRERDTDDVSREKAPAPKIALSGGKLGKTTKVVRRIKLIRKEGSATTPIPGSPRPSEKTLLLNAKDAAPLGMGMGDKKVSRREKGLAIGAVLHKVAAVDKRGGLVSNVRHDVCDADPHFPPESTTADEPEYTCTSPPYTCTSPPYTCTSPPYTCTSPQFVSPPRLAPLGEVVDTEQLAGIMKKVTFAENN